MSAVEIAVIAGCALLGLLSGSFANVVIARVPEDASVVRPGSACPSCGAAIAPRDNVPLVSWLLLRGRCRSCGARISPRYPLVELGMAVAFALVGWRVGADWALPAFLLFTWTLIVIAVIDARTRRIPNRLTYPLTPALAVLLVGAALLDGDPPVALRVLLGGLVAFGVYFVLVLINPNGMGIGDLKLAPFIGMGLAYLSWAHLALGLFGAFLIGGVVSIALMALRIKGRKDHIPFGPYMSAAGVVTLVAGTPLVRAYLSLTGLV
jgi:leader peptidase (prepilin peptidase) / N-methyltransferase